LLEDTDMLFQWQCDPRTRRYFKTARIPDYKEHSDWVESRILAVSSYTEIIMYSAEPVGVIRLDPFFEGYANGPEYIISIYIAPDKYGQGIAKKAIEVISNIFYDVTLLAEILPDNRASQAIFGGCGFVKSGQNNLYVRHLEKSRDVCR
jgi:RimJ/RimL family protein N-acetyltransferase